MKSFLGGVAGGFVAFFLLFVLLVGVSIFTWYDIFDGLDEDFNELDETYYEWVDKDLREVMLKVESYYRIFGFYPDSLALALGSTEVYDPLTEDCECGDSDDFFYKILADGDSYSLFSKGSDCKPFTKDDYHLEIPSIEMASIGINQEYMESAAVDASDCRDI